MIRKILYFMLALLFTAPTFAQTPTDLQFMPKGYLCAGLFYNYNSWEKYWEADRLRTNGNIGTVTTQQFGLAFNYGILNSLNFIVMAPYVKTDASKGTLNGQSDLQDLSIHLKGRYLNKHVGIGTLTLGGTLCFSTPMSRYIVDFAPLNVGAGTTNLSYRQMAAFQLDKGFFLGLKANYTYRSNIPNIHRDFYFDQNTAYYSNEVKVNDVLDWTLALGYSTSRILAEVDFNHTNTLGGSDIRTWDPGFPSNNMDFSNVLGRFDYYLRENGGLNFSLKLGYTLLGRNTGKAVFGNLGVFYMLPVWKNN